MKQFKNILLLSVLIMACNAGFSQCADTSNIYSFIYNGHSYDVVRENKTWQKASACAVSRNGYLAEINDSAEQSVIFSQLTNNASITASKTQNQFGTASVWLGGTDQGTEGEWIWDGDNNGSGPLFWNGAANGTPASGSYTNWGTSPAEPDNSGGQDHLTIIIKSTAVNYGLWNDLISSDTIYYLIEYNSITALEDLKLKDNISIYPNPFNDFISIVNNSSITINRITITNLLSQKIKTISPHEIIKNEIDVSNLDNGMYILNAYFENGKSISQKIVK